MKRPFVIFNLDLNSRDPKKDFLMSLGLPIPKLNPVIPEFRVKIFQNYPPRIKFQAFGEVKLDNVFCYAI